MAKVISPLLLAAGQSARFGSDKLLYSLTHNGETKPLILHAIEPWLENFSVLNIVVRPDNHELINTLQNAEFASHLRLIEAVGAETGMSASLISGIKATQHADAWLIGLADMPRLNPHVIHDSFNALLSGALLTQPEFEGRRGHPVGFSSQFLPELLKLTGDKGGKSILAPSAKDITVIKSRDESIYRDIDTKANI